MVVVNGDVFFILFPPLTAGISSSVFIDYFPSNIKNRLKKES